MSTFTERMIRAAKLDVTLYEEVEADKSLLGQAVGVVVISSLAAGIGSIQQAGTSGLVTGTLAALIGWYLWALLTYLIGTRILPEEQTRADQGQLLRTIGFSSSPGILRVFGFIPILGWIVVAGASIWMLIAMVIAVRQALDYRSTMRAVGVCLIGWLVQIIILGIFFALAAGMA